MDGTNIPIKGWRKISTRQVTRCCANKYESIHYRKYYDYMLSKAIWSCNLQIIRAIVRRLMVYISFMFHIGEA